MNLLRQIFTGFLLLYACWFKAQSSITFTIVDNNTKNVIQFAYAVIQGKNISAQSDENGIVRLTGELTDTVVVYQLGYHLKKITVGQIIEGKYIVVLKSKEFILNEVVVKGVGIDTFEKNNETVFLDFEFYDDFILALVNNGKKYNSLFLLSMNGQPVSKLNLKIYAENMVKDCFENIHLLTRDSIYQVYYNYFSIQLLKPFPIVNYFQYVKPCECYFGNTYIFKAQQYRKLKNTYYIYSDAARRRDNVLACVADSDAIKGFNMDFDINYFLSIRRKGYGYLTSVSEINKNIDQYREEFALPESYSNLLKPVESEIKRIDTSFILFDYSNKKRYEYSLAGSFKNKKSLTGFSKITPKMHIDHDRRSIIFSEMNKQGLLTLFKYDNLTNCFTQKFSLDGFHFVTNFKIKDNSMYFITKQRSAGATKTKLIKQAISWVAIGDAR